MYMAFIRWMFELFGVLSMQGVHMRQCWYGIGNSAENFVITVNVHTVQYTILFSAVALLPNTYANTRKLTEVILFVKLLYLYI